MQDQPLIVPADDPLRLGEDLGDGGQRTKIGTDVMDNSIVEAKKRQVQLIDNQVLVIAGIDDQRSRLGVSRDIEA